MKDSNDQIKSVAGSSIPKLTKADEYPAQGAYIGFLLTDILSTRLGMRLADVELTEGCRWFEMEIFCMMKKVR